MSDCLHCDIHELLESRLQEQRCATACRFTTGVTIFLR